MKKINILLLASVLFISTCDLLEVPTISRDNPFDEKNSEYVAPAVIITSGPTNGSKLESDAVTFQWEGNDIAEEFSYQLNEDSWSDWSTNTSANFNYLEDSEYIFNVVARSITGEERIGNINSVSFIIDAIKGPAFIFKPKSITIQQNQSFEISIYAEEVVNLGIFNLTINFESGLILNTIEIEEEFLLQDGGSIVDFIEINNEQGSANISIGLVETENISGSGKIATLSFANTNSGQKIISFDSNSDIRNSENQPISVKLNEQCQVKVD